jgi:predicted transposase YbfD/YdcC
LTPKVLSLLRQFLLIITILNVRCWLSGAIIYPDTHQKRTLEYIRNHWGIEKKLRWILDVHLKEACDQKIERKSGRIFALLRRIALNIVRTKDIFSKKSLKRKLKNTPWNNGYLLSLLT